MIDLDVYFLKKFKEFFLKYFLLKKVYEKELQKYAVQLTQLIHNSPIYELNKTVQIIQNCKSD